MNRKSLKSAILAVLIGAGLVFALPAFGQEVTRSVVLKRDARLGGQTLSQGKYTIKFDESKSGDVVFVRDVKEVVKTYYKITTLPKNAQDDAVVYTAGDGGFVIKRIEFRGLKAALQFD